MTGCQWADALYAARLELLVECRRAVMFPHCIPTCRCSLHPGMFDACIHLAPVPAAGAPIAITRVPVAAGALLLPAADGEQLSEISCLLASLHGS